MKEKKTTLHDLHLKKNHEVNLIKWDNCINNAHNGSIYGFSWYLDIICGQWHAIIQRDYEAIMPILVKHKAGITYVPTSLFASQLGVFSTEIIDTHMVNNFIRKVFENFRIFTVDLNKFNQVHNNLFHQRRRLTYEFDLIRNYSLLRDSYSTGLLRELDEAEKKKITVVPGMTPNDFMKFISGKGIMATKGLNKEQFNKLRMIIAFVLKHGLGEINAAYTRENNLCAAILFLKSNRKINLLFSAATAEGFKQRALQKIIDEYIRKHAEKNLTISFEHLVMPNKAAVSEGFGAQQYSYLTVSNMKNPLMRKIFS